MKRIVCFTESLSGGGAEHQLAILANLLAENGYEVSFVTYSDLPDHYQLSNSIKRINLTDRKSAIGRLFSVLLYFLQVKTDCVISYRQACNARVIIPLLFRSKKKINLICGERNTHYGKSDKYEKFLFGGAYKRANYIVANSFTQKDYINTIRPRWSNKVYTIINYTDLNNYSIVKLPPYKDCFRIGVFSRVGLQKNVRNFIIAMNNLKNETSKKFEVHWYGNVESDCPYKQWAEEYKTGEYLFFHSAVKDTRLFMGQFNAICQPSLFEGFSNSISEAICCGMPMLVGDVSDNSIMVKDGINGYLFNPTEVQSIVSSFLKIFLLDDNQLEQFGKESRVIAESLFDKEVFVSSYTKLIENEPV